MGEVVPMPRRSSGDDQPRRSVRFALNGSWFEIDLTDGELAKLTEALRQ